MAIHLLLLLFITAIHGKKNRLRINWGRGLELEYGEIGTLEKKMEKDEATFNTPVSRDNEENDHHFWDGVWDEEIQKVSGSTFNYPNMLDKEKKIWDNTLGESEEKNVDKDNDGATFNVPDNGGATFNVPDLKVKDEDTIDVIITVKNDKGFMFAKSNAVKVNQEIGSMVALTVTPEQLEKLQNDPNILYVEEDSMMYALPNEEMGLGEPANIGGSYLGSTNEEEEIGSAPSSSPCIVCSDVPTPFMESEGKKCFQYQRAMFSKCNKDSAWISSKYCQKSCFKAGNGYEGDICC